MIVIHPAAQHRLTRFEWCCWAGAAGLVLCTVTGRSGYRYTVLERARA